MPRDSAGGSNSTRIFCASDADKNWAFDGISMGFRHYIYIELHRYMRKLGSMGFLWELDGKKRGLNENFCGISMEKPVRFRLFTRDFGWYLYRKVAGDHLVKSGVVTYEMARCQL